MNTTSLVALGMMIIIAGIAAANPFAAIIFAALYICAGRTIYLKARIIVAHVQKFLEEGDK